MSDDREHRNQVFTQSPDPRATGLHVHAPAAPSHVASPAARTGLEFEVPHEVVPLPSSGKVYHAEHPLHMQETVDIKAMTAKEEDILTSRALLKKGTVITELIRSCLVNKQINPVDLLGGDRNSLMVAIRVTGYGADYDAEIECQACSVKSKQKFNLGEFPIRRLSIDPVVPGMNLFEFKLPMSKKLVKFKFMTGRDEEEILATQERQKKLGLNADANVTTNLLYSIVSVDGIEDRAKIAMFVKAMPARDSLELRKYIRDNEPGIQMKQEVICPSCGHEEEVSMPLGVTFLWPTAG